MTNMKVVRTIQAAVVTLPILWFVTGVDVIAIIWFLVVLIGPFVLPRRYGADGG
jgi:hypothetical protein